MGILSKKDIAEKKRILLKLFYGRDYVRALQVYEDIITYIEPEADLRKIGGDLYLSTGSKDLALGEYRKALELLIEQKSLDKAKIIAQKISNLAPQDLDILSTIGDIYYQKSELENAAKYMAMYIKKSLAIGRKEAARFMLDRIKRRGLMSYLPPELKSEMGQRNNIQTLKESIEAEEIFKTFKKLLKKEVARGNRYSRYFCIVMINSTSNREFDKLSTNRMSILLKESLREADIFHIGKHWVFTILPETNKYGGQKVLSRIKEVLNNEFLDLHFYFSNFPENGISDKELIDQALQYKNVI